MLQTDNWPFNQNYRFGSEMKKVLTFPLIMVPTMYGVTKPAILAMVFVIPMSVPA